MEVLYITVPYKAIFYGENPIDYRTITSTKVTAVCRPMWIVPSEKTTETSEMVSGSSLHLLQHSFNKYQQYINKFDPSTLLIFVDS